MIQFYNVTKQYQNGDAIFTALRNVSLHIQRGEFVSILGASGSGKSTLMHSMGGLDKPTSGVIGIAGWDIGHMSGKRLAQFRNERIGFVFQFFNLLPHLTALQNVMLPLVYSTSRKNRKAKAVDLLERVGLGNKFDNTPTKLSGGEQQRVAIARALVGDPQLILADEPTGNLDTKTGAQIMDMLFDLHRQGKTIVMVTHDEHLASKTQRIIRIQDGKVIPN